MKKVFTKIFDYKDSPYQFDEMKIKYIQESLEGTQCLSTIKNFKVVLPSLAKYKDIFKKFSFEDKYGFGNKNNDKRLRFLKKLCQEQDIKNVIDLLKKTRLISIDSFDWKREAEARREVSRAVIFGGDASAFLHHKSIVINPLELLYFDDNFQEVVPIDIDIAYYVTRTKMGKTTLVGIGQETDNKKPEERLYIMDLVDNCEYFLEKK